MRPPPPHAAAPSPRVFNYSLDWRFLLPMADFTNVGLLFDEDADFTRTLEQVGIHASQELSVSALRDSKHHRFQYLVMPFGLPVGWTGAKQADRVEFYFTIRRFIDTGGYLLIGFNNILNWRSSFPINYHASTPRQIALELQQAGFRSVKMFGAMPNLAIPEYIFDLDSQTIEFALHNRFRRKPVILIALRVLAGIVGSQRISNCLPCYFALATA